MKSAPCFTILTAFLVNTLFAQDSTKPASSVSERSEKPTTNAIVKTYSAGSGKYQINIDTTIAPDLTEWSEKNLAPVAEQWYPKLVQMLPSEGFEAPTNITIRFREGMRDGIPAAAGGDRISCNVKWFRNNLKGEAVGAVVHEMVHVVQQYGWGRKKNPNATRNPGWIVEGIPDYIRWFLYEPESKGAEITKRNIAKAKYDSSYRVTGNFLNWVTEKYDKQIVAKMNAAAREGRYDEKLWKDYTGKTVEDLGTEWRQGHADRLGVQLAQLDAPGSKGGAGTDGWVSLFNGKNFDGWHNFKTNTVRAGWQVQDGVLVCADPHNAGDLCTSNQFGSFELELDYNISSGGNSGIMFHVTDEGRAAWATGPEFQLEDNAKAADPQRCGWLYALYQPPIDPKTNKPLDATKPAGEWNHVRLLVLPKNASMRSTG